MKTDYGISLESILLGTHRPPPERARVDIAFEGHSTGPKIRGRIRGMEYLHIRADGRIELHLHAEITTEDGQRIALEANGVASHVSGSSIAKIRENVTLTTNFADYRWVNGLQIWAPGTVDFAKSEIEVRGFAL